MATLSSPCTMCDKPDSRQCARCHSTQYCSKNCQQADWASHKLLCRPLSEFLEKSKRPSKNHFSAILFPDDQEKPKLVWIHCPWIDEGEEWGYQLADPKPFLRADEDSSNIFQNPRLKRDLTNTT
ncbi:uncharacterized protein J3D65DRAFT_669037 [Phyllosticta citribraziliensis]|uniref:MYND-type domain-containing protein n=1 Tax=Phyllosticta citribraziliensis TaxID=989973 RepID=A0ABR1LI48_9PEZI